MVCRLSISRIEVKSIAIYHCSIKIFSRGKGASAVAKSAYRAAEKIHNEYNGITSDYTHKSGVVHKEILLPDHAPIEYKDRAVLWNAVEKCERYKTAQLAREIEISLPVELSREQNIILAREYVQKYFVDKGMCADLCVHDPKGDNPNPHAHIMLTMRPIKQNGTWGVKSKSEHILDDNGERIKLSNGNWKSVKVPTVDWNEHTKAEEWRCAWADILNSHLEKHGHAEKAVRSADGEIILSRDGSPLTTSNKVDHRSYVVCCKGRFGETLLHIRIRPVCGTFRGIALNQTRGSRSTGCGFNMGKVVISIY